MLQSMEARCLSVLLALAAFGSVAASHRTPNFIVNAPTPEIAKQVGQYAEHYRREIAVTWLGNALPNWSAPCPIQVKVGQLGAGGATTFSFDRGEVSGWKMNVQGSLERVLDSVLPHEVSHTIFACHFRRPLPRWADEGAATLVEHESERMRQQQLVRQILGSRQRIPLRNLLGMTEYPTNMQDVMTLYAEGYALCDLLVQKGGRSRYLSFLTAAHKQGWERALKSHYGFQSIDALETEWKDWIIAGCPAQVAPAGEVLASTQPAKPAGRPAADVVMRSQSPDDEAPLAAQRRPSSLPRIHREPLGQGLEAPVPQRGVASEAPVASQISLGPGQTLARGHALSAASVKNASGSHSAPKQAGVAGRRNDDAGWVAAPDSRRFATTARQIPGSGFSMPTPQRVPSNPE
jgi:hypothetical protein